MQKYIYSIFLMETNYFTYGYCGSLIYNLFMKMKQFYLIQEMLSEDHFSNDEQSNDEGESGLSTPDSVSSVKHVHKKMKISNSDDDDDDDDSN